MYAIEIPHQMKAKVYECTEEEFIRMAGMDGFEHEDEDIPEITEAIEFVGHDLHAIYTFSSQEELAKFVNSYTGHQAGTVKVQAAELLGDVVANKTVKQIEAVDGLIRDCEKKLERARVDVHLAQLKEEELRGRLVGLKDVKALLAYAL